MGQGVWGFMLEGAGRLEMVARNVAKSWRHLPNSMDPLEKKILSKFGKGTRSISFGLEGVFTVKRNSVIKFYRAVVKGTFRALLTIGRR